MNRHRWLPLASLTAATFALACSHGSASSSSSMGMGGMEASPALASMGKGFDESVVRDLGRLRAATDKFHDLAAAQAAGYPTVTPQCLQNPAAGGMGLHYVQREIVDTTLDVEHPEILLYEPSGNGKPKLTGAEYIVPYRLWAPDQKPPRIFGQNLKQSPELKLWYLHVWAWKENKSGLFADWNPAVKC